ncbi:hypothetical protein SAMN05192550_3159 [Flavobacterium glycines]|uniref:Cytochrome c domain-containing protein n=1 Tax=Flavobacterium glycines TaxID=551990 RepID=A0A1B9DX13_9FLAO|nr:hypothetical protein [Flavobacterium glycines]OCB74220.1 hypothetical protein FBGL_02100 [Flavobacterium glycines]GEL12270.1 hypothetical protein FGL01_30090 [Flavobacterium glycines]SDK00967.1 hypothetical protein SAMN05192550_3159 [Flavobacterium glycines]
MRTIFKLYSATLLLVMSSCSSGGDSNSDPDPDPTPTTITYTNTISSIISANCISCHASTPTNGATISLNTYAKVKTAVESNGLIDRISLPQGNTSMMPKDGTRLPQATIDKFTNWKNNGYPE